MVLVVCIPPAFKWLLYKVNHDQFISGAGYKLAYALLDTYRLNPFTPQLHPAMNSIFSIIFMMAVLTQATGQTVARVDKKTKEFYIPASPKTQYRIFGYEYPNTTTRKMICFSSYTGDVGANMYNCPLGSSFDTSLLKEGDKIVYLGVAGSYSKMNYI